MELKILLLGIAIGMGVKIVPVVNQHVVLPVQHHVVAPVAHKLQHVMHLKKKPKQENPDGK